MNLLPIKRFLPEAKQPKFLPASKEPFTIALLEGSINNFRLTGEPQKLRVFDFRDRTIKKAWLQHGEQFTQPVLEHDPKEIFDIYLMCDPQTLPKQALVRHPYPTHVGLVHVSLHPSNWDKKNKRIVKTFEPELNKHVELWVISTEDQYPNL